MTTFVNSELRSVTETLAGMFDCALPTVIANGSPTERFNPTAEMLQHGPDWRLLEVGVTTRASSELIESEGDSRIG